MLVVIDNINAYKRINGKLILPNLIDSVINSELVAYIDSHYHTMGLGISCTCRLFKGRRISDE